MVSGSGGLFFCLIILVTVGWELGVWGVGGFTFSGFFFKGLIGFFFSFFARVLGVDWEVFLVVGFGVFGSFSGFGLGFSGSWVFLFLCRLSSNLKASWAGFFGVFGSISSSGLLFGGWFSLFSSDNPF